MVTQDSSEAYLKKMKAHEDVFSKGGEAAMAASRKCQKMFLAREG